MLRGNNRCNCRRFLLLWRRRQLLLRLPWRPGRLLGGHRRPFLRGARASALRLRGAHGTFDFRNSRRSGRVRSGGARAGRGSGVVGNSSDDRGSRWYWNGEARMHEEAGRGGALEDCAQAPDEGCRCVDQDVERTRMGRCKASAPEGKKERPRQQAFKRPSSAKQCSNLTRSHSVHPHVDASEYLPPLPAQADQRVDEGAPPVHHRAPLRGYSPW